MIQLQNVLSGGYLNTYFKLFKVLHSFYTVKTVIPKACFSFFSPETLHSM